MKISNTLKTDRSFSKVKKTYPSSRLVYKINPTMRIPPKGYIWSVLQGKFILDLRE